VRDRRIDFWRGLCLIDMMVVHLVYQGLKLGEPLQGILGEYTRFAAGGFILLSGLAIGAIYLPRALDPARRRASYEALAWRAVFILGVHYATEIGLLFAWPLMGGVAVERLGHSVREILLLRAGCDLLPFYVIMLLASPLMLELLRRRRDWLLAGASIAIFLIGQLDPYLVRLPLGTEFFPMLWQMIFVAGVLAGAHLKSYDLRAIALKRSVAIAFTAASVVLWLGAFGHDWSIHLHLPLTFWKAPLTLGEALKYLAMVALLVTASDLAWKWIGSSRVIAEVARMGRYSLPVYVLHIWIVRLLEKFSATFELYGPINLVLVLGGVLGMWAFACWLDREKSPVERKAPARWQVALRPPIVAGAIAVALFAINPLLPRMPAPDAPGGALDRPGRLSAIDEDDIAFPGDDSMPTFPLDESRDAVIGVTA
jgi:hypothetical protein